MPDGDRIHPTLNRRFHNVYGQICEGHWDAPELGYKMLHPLKGQLIEYGNAPIVMGQSIVPILESAMDTISKGGSFSFADVSNQISALSKSPDMNCSPRGRDLMIESANQLLVRIQHKEAVNDIGLALYEAYIDTVYIKDCDSRVEDPPRHYKDASHVEVRQIMNSIHPYVRQGQADFARQLVKGKDVGKLKRKRWLKEPPLSVNDVAW